MTHDRAQMLLLVRPPQWHGHTNTIIDMAVGHTGLMQRYAPDRRGLGLPTPAGEIPEDLLESLEIPLVSGFLLYKRPSKN
jgi:hypothetical protein